jgi:CheY-like chemotaxis protein
MKSHSQHLGGLRVLVVEDNPADLAMAHFSLTRIDPACILTVATDGEQAIRLLEDEDINDRSPFDLILLDLNLPRFDGLDVLKVIRRDRQIVSPVVMFSTWIRDADRKRALDLGANETVTKPGHVEEVVKAFSEIVTKWCGR